MKKTVIWASALKPGTSAQRAELIALTQALKKAKDKKVNIYTDSRKLSIIHCPGHQRGNDPVAEGNRMANETARAAALGPQEDRQKPSPPNEKLPRWLSRKS